MNFKRRRRKESRVDITPLIDIVFQLLIFFMVTTSFVTMPGIKVKLPRSSSQTILHKKNDLDVWMTAKGVVYLNHAPVSWDALRGAFVEAAAKDANTLVVIRADKHVEHGKVVAVLDLARSNGLSRLAIATENPGGKPSGAR